VVTAAAVWATCTKKQAVVPQEATRKGGLFALSARNRGVPDEVTLSECRSPEGAATAHGEHEARTGQADPNWPDWYAEYMVREQSGEELPK